MATWEDVARIALALPETDEGISRDLRHTGACRTRGFVWERPLRRSDLVALGDAAPEGPILGARVEQPTVRTRVIEVSANGFDWRDAAIGAAATGGLVLLATGGFGAAHRARTRPTR
jgi:hypothetical protein